MRDCLEVTRAKPNDLQGSLSTAVARIAAFWTKAKYGKVSIEGRDPVNAEAPHYREAGAVDDEKILITPRNANIPGSLQVREINNRR